MTKKKNDKENLKAVKKLEELTYGEKRLMMDIADNRMKRFEIFISIMSNNFTDWESEFGEIAVFDDTVPTIANIRHFSALDVLTFLERFSKEDYKNYECMWTSRMRRYIPNDEYDTALLDEMRCADQEYGKYKKVYERMFRGFLDKLYFFIQDEINDKIRKSDDFVEIANLYDMRYKYRTEHEHIMSEMFRNGDFLK